MLPEPVNVSPEDGAVNVSTTPTLIAKGVLNTIERAFTEQYDGDDGRPVVVGWENDPRR
jgi:hypothetical protein